MTVFLFSFFFFFNDTATTEIYTLSLHDALPISGGGLPRHRHRPDLRQRGRCGRSEEHTSELQSPCNLVCRLLLEKKKITHKPLVSHRKNITSFDRRPHSAATGSARYASVRPSRR